MKRDPSFPLYAADWLTGEATTAMLPEQEGAFIRVLCYAWLAEPPCTIPDDDRVLAQVSKLGSRWKRLGALVKAQFMPVSDAAGRLRNAKLYAVFLEREEFRKVKQDNGRKGGRPRTKPEPSENLELTETEPNGKPSLSSLSSSSSSEESKPITGGSGRGRSESSRAHENNDDSGDNWEPPFNSQRMFQFKVDEVRKWTERVIKDTGDGPGEDEFESSFKSKFGMTWRYWQDLSECCEAHYTRAMTETG